MIFLKHFLTPKYLKGTVRPDTSQSLLGTLYSSPFGVVIGSGV